MTDEWPIEIDHINNAVGDDRWINLRNATSQQNKANRIVRNDSKTQVKGVYKHHNKYVAYIIVNQKKIHLGCYSTLDEASLAYKEAAIKYFGAFANG